MSNSLIKDNHNNGSVGEFLKKVITPNSNVSIVSAYFTIFAYKNLKQNLDNIEKLRFLFGEPTFIQSVNPEKLSARNYKIEDEQLTIPIKDRLTQKAIASECSEWIANKTEIRSLVEPNFLHGKLYHIEQENKAQDAISGSSNFTVNGLGLGNGKNIELNMVIDSKIAMNELKNWFDAIWNDTGLVKDVKSEVLEYISQLYKENDPEFIYFKTLYHIFEKYLSEQEKGGLLNEKTGFYDSEVWNKLYDFQKDGVKGAINKILKHNGCIIADSVGLGKTFEALAVIKYFELLNERVLVICPKKLQRNWTVYQAGQNHDLNPFKKDRFNFVVLYHTDMGREGISKANNIDLNNFNWGNFDLIVIDESHNFRGNPMEKVKVDSSIKMNRAKWLMEKVIRSGVKTKVLMLSATPVNNTLRDLRNQIAFITEGKEDALNESCNIRSINSILKSAQTTFSKWAESKKTDPNRNTKQLLDQLDPVFPQLLDELTIARSRKHIVKFYKAATYGSFPIREKPISIYPEIDLDKRFPPYDKINKQILQYKLCIFNPTAYVKPNCQKKYEDMVGKQILNFKQTDREYYLIGMMKVNFLKRLESSIESFEISMERTIRKIEDLEKKISDFLDQKIRAQITIIDNLEPTADDLEDDSEEMEWQVGKKLKFDLADLKLDDWLKDLGEDRQALTILLNAAKVVTPDKDAKLVELKKIIREKTLNPINNTNKKVIVFTAFADTAKYLYENIKKWAKSELKLNSAIVCGNHFESTFGKNNFDDILVNFSPLSKDRIRIINADQTGEIDILIATDCISEGQNLQDCDYLINYDIHWNPVRIIQRFGRIDRFGSINKRIQLVNFWPTKDLDLYLNLKTRVEARMALVDVTATGEDDLLNNEQIEVNIADELKFRSRQLKKLQDEVLDLEEMDDSISLTDFTLDDFRGELLNFLDTDRKKLEESPLGLYAIVPAPTGEHASMNKDKESLSLAEKEIIKPGIIFCLAQKTGLEGNNAVNPTNPYFLVYIREDGTVRFNFTHSKQILEVYRVLCQGIRVPYAELCKLFNEETESGAKVDDYSNLLKKAVDEIVHVFKKKGNAKLTSDRSAVLIPKIKQINELEDFELITWLIVR